MKITDIRLATHDIIKKYEQLLEDVNEIEKLRDQTISRITELNNLKQLISDQQEEIRLEKIKIEQRKLEVKQILDATETNRRQIEKDLLEVRRGKEILEEIQNKRDEFKLEEVRLERKRKEVDGISQLKEELIKQQAIVDREKAIDRERKQVLDQREHRIKLREQQLQIQAEI